MFPYLHHGDLILMSQVAARHPLLSSPEHVKHLHKLIEGNMWWRWVEVFKPFQFLGMWQQMWKGPVQNRILQKWSWRIEGGKVWYFSWDEANGVGGGLLGLGIDAFRLFGPTEMGPCWMMDLQLSFPMIPLESLRCLIRQSKGAQQKTVKSLEFHFRALNGRCRGPGKLR